MSKPNTPPLTNSAAKVTRTPSPPARQVSTTQRGMDAPIQRQPLGQGPAKKR